MDGGRVFQEFRRTPSHTDWTDLLVRYSQQGARPRKGPSWLLLYQKPQRFSYLLSQGNFFQPLAVLLAYPITEAP